MSLRAWCSLRGATTIAAATFVAAPVAADQASAAAERELTPRPPGAALLGATAWASAAQASEVVWAADLDRGLSDYWKVTNPRRVTVVDDPTGRARKVAKLTVFDGDRGPTTSDPRAQLSSPRVFNAGADLWVGWSTLFPTSGFPASVPGWLVFESVYGPPYRGPGPQHFMVRGSEIVYERNGTYDFDRPWRMPLVRGRWVDFVLHQRMSHDPEQGFLELWVNTGSGWKQQELGGRRRLHMRTMDQSNAQANMHSLQLYRDKGILDVATVYHASHKIGRSFDAVAPSSYR
jgi:hypothetical protein